VNRAIETAELDQLQSDFKAAVDRWVASIREEEALASTEHSVTEIDKWEEATRQQEAAGDEVKAAKRRYENALREEFFSF
jgi:hypothetical protein